jgi:cell division protein FtsI (penicillin-binding protein 3)
VVIVNPKKGKYYGGAIAAPVFREIADKIYASQPDICNPLSRDTLMALIPSAHPGRKQDTEQVLAALGIRTSQPSNASPWIRPEGGDDRVALTPLAISRYTMPDVRGMGLKDAIYLLEQLGLRVIVNGKGTVATQSVPPGKMIQKGTTVMITLQVKSIQTASL